MLSYRKSIGGTGRDAEIVSAVIQNAIAQTLTARGYRRNGTHYRLLATSCWLLAASYGNSNGEGKSGISE